MRPLILLCCCFALACAKSAAPADPGDGGSSSGPGSSGTPVQSHPASISVFINNTPMTVTGISYTRAGNTVNFSAWNSLQKVDAYTFWFYGTSGFDYQYSDSINYSTRPDSLSAWSTIRASGGGEVYYDCCMAPWKDSPVSGVDTAIISQGKENTTITGRFYLPF